MLALSVMLGALLALSSVVVPLHASQLAQHAAAGGSAAEQVIYVSAGAAETAGATAGSAASPFPTIEAARNHLRVLRAKSTSNGGQRRFRVVIGAGTYAPLELQAQDSGSPGRPIVYEADSSRGPVVVSAGIQVPKSAFTPWAGHPGIIKADLSALMVDYGSITAGGDCGGNCTGFAKAGLVFSNLSMVLARWPNVDNATGRYVWQKVQIGGPNGFSVKDPAVVSRIAKWTAETEPWLHSYSKYDWSDTWNRINISASGAEVNLTIVDYPAADAAQRSTPATPVTDPPLGATDGVWVIKITAQAGQGWSKPTVVCNGTASDTFRVHAVATGSPQDPLKGACKKWGIATQNILQVSSDSGATWRIASSNSTSGIPGTLACGNDKQKVASATFGEHCEKISGQAKCAAQGRRCAWKDGHCVAPPPPPAPPPATTAAADVVASVHRRPGKVLRE